MSGTNQKCFNHEKVYDFESILHIPVKHQNNPNPFANVKS